jgi:hypothetical protein
MRTERNFYNFAAATLEKERTRARFSGCRGESGWFCTEFPMAQGLRFVSTEHRGRLRSREGGTTMKNLLLTLVGVGALAAIGCNSGEPPSEVREDVAAASRDQAQDMAETRREAAEDIREEQADVGGQVGDVNEAQANGAYDIAMAKAEGDHDVATEKCEALSGDAQKACKDQADARYNAAKAAAKTRYDRENS